MSLTKEDLKKIKDVVNSGNEVISARIDSFEAYIKERFDKTDQRLEHIEKKIEQLIKTETEDIQVAFKEIKVLKSRLKKIESKIYSKP